ncbi:MAG: methylenetetrahydrofolate reductase [Betaproteobacteria bacterium]|nr:methylenetetrahydrofolate reductase [Betaproteobacteria bacterium]
MTTAATASDAVAECETDLISCGSIEMSAHLAEDARTLGNLLPAGTKVYVNHLPRHTLADTLSALEAVRRAGLEPVPHVAARRVATRKELEAFLTRAVRDAGVQKVLLIGGDDPRPLGQFADSVALLKSGVFAACGVREVGIAGYPEGHAHVPRASLDSAMAEKLALAKAQGLGAYVVTQFSFAPARVVEYCSALSRNAPGVPVYVGLAGPADPARLLRFAQRCGVSASLRALRAQGMGLVRLVTHTDPGEQLTAVARYCSSHEGCNIVGAHLFSFGGAANTAEWMNRALAARR